MATQNGWLMGLEEELRTMTWPLLVGHWTSSNHHRAYKMLDWIHEYTIERLRKRALMSTSGIASQINLWVDASQAWVVLILSGMWIKSLRDLGSYWHISGIAAGLIAAGIDIASIWLADLKGGFCDTTFYLSKGFCCWGYSSELPWPHYRFQFTNWH